MELRSENTTVFKKDLSKYGQIFTVELSPFKLSQDLILLGVESQVLLGHIKIEEQVTDFEVLRKFAHKERCCALAFSPQTSTNVLPKHIFFAAAGADYKIRVFKSDMRDEDVCVVLSEHTSYVNDIKFDPDNSFLASVSDDKTAKLWETEELKLVASLQLTSPGVSVCWHQDDSSKLLVAEKIGLARFYNVETQSPILSVDYGKPLSSAHWAPSDSQLLASLQLGELLIWDLTKPCVPLMSSLIFPESGGHVRFSPLGELVAAVNNLDCTLKVVQVQNNQLKLAAHVTLPSNVSYHCRCPIVCVGDYMTLCFWKVTSK